MNFFNISFFRKTNDRVMLYRAGGCDICKEMVKMKGATIEMIRCRELLRDISKISLGLEGIPVYVPDLLQRRMDLCIDSLCDGLNELSRMKYVNVMYVGSRPDLIEITRLGRKWLRGDGNEVRLGRRFLIF